MVLVHFGRNNANNRQIAFQLQQDQYRLNQHSPVRVQITRRLDRLFFR